MKKYHIMSLLILGAVAFQSCSNGSKTEKSISSKSGADTTLDTTNMNAGATVPATELDTAEKAFIFKAGTDGRVELEAAKFILLRTKNPEVKTFAQMMVKDHTEIENKLIKTAKDVGVGLPALLPDKKDLELQKLMESQREELDKKYMIMMVNAHKKAINLFDKASTFKNEQLRSFAMDALPRLKHHEKMATDLGNKLNISNRGNGDNLSSVEPDTL